MPKKKNLLEPFAALTWAELHAWAGSRIANRGREYQQQGLVCDLATTREGALLAWVKGSRRYATQVRIDADGELESFCTCPFGLPCKHAVALVLEYLSLVEQQRSIPVAPAQDKRLALLAEEGDPDEGDLDEDDLGGDDPDEESEKPAGLPEELTKAVTAFLNGKTRKALAALLLELAQRFPEIAQELADRQQLGSGESRGLVKRLKHEIQRVSAEPGWQNPWDRAGFTPDYSGIRAKLETLIKTGHADKVLPLGLELIQTGMAQVEQSDDEGETAEELARCMPILVQALRLASLPAVDKLTWALDAELADEFEVCSAFADYLHEVHPQPVWHALADRLRERLDGLCPPSKDRYCGSAYRRDRLSDWLIHALQQAGREREIIALCEAEAEKTCSYERLVQRLIAAKRLAEAERWIRKGIRATEKDLPGITEHLRKYLATIRTAQKDWPAVAALAAEEFVRHPWPESYATCQKSAEKIGAWEEVRRCLLQYLESGRMPWRQPGWPLPPSGFDAPAGDRRRHFPNLGVLIEIALHEKTPQQVLHWYDRLRQQRRSAWQHAVDEDRVAGAIQEYAPERAVAIWKTMAERQIALVKPSAYEEAVRYLAKARKVMAREQKQEQWRNYVQQLRSQHARKRKLIATLDALDEKPILKKRS